MTPNPAHNTDADDVLRLVWEIPRLWRTAMDRRLKPLGLSEAKWRTVLHLAHGPADMNQSELANRLGIEAPTLARLLDRLAKDGWLERRINAQDRRVKSIHLLPKAAGVIRQIDRAMNEMRDQVLRGAKAKDIRTSLTVLRTIRSRTEQASLAAKLPTKRKPK